MSIGKQNMRFLFPIYLLEILWLLLFLGLATPPSSSRADDLREILIPLKEEPQPNAALPLADQAYEAYNSGRYEEAFQLAEQALAKQPGDYYLNILLINILEREKAWTEVEARLTALLADRPDDAYALASRGFARMNLDMTDEAGADFQEALRHNPAAGLKANILAALEQVEQNRAATRLVEGIARSATEPSLADQAFEAYNSGRYEEARRLAEQALTEQPGDYYLNILLVNTFEQEKAWPKAEAILTRILAEKPDDIYALASRGFARLHQMRLTTAAEDFRLALEQGPTDDVLLNILDAIDQIKQMTALEEAAARRIRPSAATIDSNSAVKLPAIQKLLTERQFEQADRQLKQLIWRNFLPQEKGLWLYLRAELLWHEENFEQALSLYQEAQYLLPEKFYQAEIWWRLAEYERGRNQAETAMEYARKSVELFPDNEIRNLQAAYLFLHFQRDSEAMHYFENALDIIKIIPDEQAFIYMDLFYAYKRLGNNKRQRDRLERYIELQDSLVAKQFPKEKQSLESLYVARREHADLIREFGWYSGNYYNHRASGDYAFQIINDFYWQPWYNNGRSVQLYGQMQATLDSRYSDSGSFDGRTYHTNDSEYFNDSVAAALGIRVDPLTEYNLILTLEKILKIGRQTRDDFRGRIGYSWDTGLELKPFEPNWLYSTFFNELTHSFQPNDDTYSGEARLGRSFRLDGLNDRLVLTPHLVSTWGYGGKEIKEKGERWYLETGLGLHLRQWYREDKYNAPQSYTDIIIQYRSGLSHRRENVFTLTLFNSF